MLVGSFISRAPQVYAETGFLGGKPVRFVTHDKQAASAARAKLGAETHEEKDAIGIIYSQDVHKYGNALISDAEKRVIALTALNFQEVENAIENF